VTCNVLPAYLFGALSTQISAELGVGETSIGIALGFFFLVTAVSSPSVGRFADRRGARAGMRVSLLLGAMSTLVLGLLGRGPLTILAGLALSGVSMAMGAPAANLALVRRVRAHSLGLAFGLKQASAPAGTLIAGLSLPLLAAQLGWRWTMVVASVLPLLVLPLVVREEVGQVAVVAGPASAVPSASVRGMSRRLLVMLAVGFGFANVGATAAGTFLVPAALSVGYSISAAGVLLASVSVVGGVVRIAVGWRADRSSSHPFRTVGSMLLLGSAGYALAVVEGGVVVFAMATLVMFGAGWGWNGLFSMGIVLENPSTPSRATGTAYAGGYVGAALGPFLFGYAAENLGYATAWLVATGASLVGAGTILAVRRALEPPAQARRNLND